MDNVFHAVKRTGIVGREGIDRHRNQSATNALQLAKCCYEDVSSVVAMDIVAFELLSHGVEQPRDLRHSCGPLSGIGIEHTMRCGQSGIFCLG